MIAISFFKKIQLNFRIESIALGKLLTFWNGMLIWQSRKSRKRKQYLVTYSSHKYCLVKYSLQYVCKTCGINFYPIHLSITLLHYEYRHLEVPFLVTLLSHFHCKLVGHVNQQLFSLKLSCSILIAVIIVAMWIIIL